MTEYKVEMMQFGKWVDGFDTWSRRTKTHATIEEAHERIEELRKIWGRVLDGCNNMNPSMSLKTKRGIPTDYRIVSREVTAWTVEQ